MTEIILRPSELAYVGDCRRQSHWNSLYVTKQSAPALWTGQFGHLGLEGYYKSGRDPDQARRSFDLRSRQLYSKLITRYPRDESTIWRCRSESAQLLDHYLIYDTQVEQLSGAIVDVERRVTLPLRDPDTGEESEDLFLSGKRDLVLARGDGIAIVDHKFLSPRTIDSGVLPAIEVDIQFTAYAYLFWREKGVVPSSIFVNVVIKSVPQAPTVIRNGSALSKDRSQPTTGALYRRALQEYGIDPEGYEGILEYFDDKGYSNFFLRIESRRNESEMWAFERTVWEIGKIVRQMREAPDRYAFPSGSIYRCGWCPFLEPCKSADDGGDSEAYFVELSRRTEEDDE